MSLDTKRPNGFRRAMLPAGSAVDRIHHAAAGRDAATVVLSNTTMVQARDCACCCDQPTPPPDCPACKGVGGFSKVAIAR